MEENCFSLAKRTDVTLAMHIAINQLSRYRTRWNPEIHIFLGFEAIMLCNCMNIYIYRIVASTNKKASPEKSCVICVQLPPESLAREDSCIYIYTILWLVVPFRPLYCCNMYYQHHHTQQQPVLNTACILRMHKNTSTKWGRVV